MKILSQDERHSERIIQKLAADILNIPETDADLEKEAAEKCLDCKCSPCECPSNKSAMTEEGKCAKCGAELVQGKCAKCASVSRCPSCDGPMQVIGNIERCACGYGKAAQKRAEDTSIGEYYRKIFPDAYVSEMTGKPKETPDKDICYEMKSNTKISAKDIIKKKPMRKMHGGAEGSGECTVPDAHPESGVGEGSGADVTPDPKWQSGESANSVTGPEKVTQHGTGLKEPDSVVAPDLGLPRGARKATREYYKCQSCGHDYKADASTTCPQCDSPEVKRAVKDSEWVTREVMAVLCPPCAEEMARRGITRVKAETIAKLIAKRADDTGWKVKKEGAAPGKKDPKGVRRAPKSAVSPPGWKGVTKHVEKYHKDEIDNPWALAWSQKNKGYKPRKERYPGHD